MARLTKKITKRVNLPDDPDKAWVEIRYLKKGVRDRIESSATTYKGQLNEESGEVGTVITYNMSKKTRTFLEEVLIAWDNFYNPQDDKIKCTVDNALKYDDEVGGFVDWLKEESDKFNEEVDKEKEPAEENSDS